MATYDLKYPGAAIDAILDTAYHLQQAGYIFRGSASDYSGTPTQRTWLLAPAGFSGYGFSSAIPKGSIGICKWNGSAWSGDVINVVTIDNYPTYGSTNAVTSGGMWNALDDLGDGIWATLQSFVIQDGTASANQGNQIKFDVKMTDGQQVQHLISSFGILAATTTKAGLMSAADKVKVDAFLDNLRSLSFTDTTPGADVGTKIVETLKMTVDGVQEAVTALTILAATTTKAGLMSAADKAYIDGLPSSLTSINADISKLLAMLGYYECSTAAGTAAKTVAATGYSLTNGGCIRIKMTNANTAANVTLNINSTGAKALYYDGAQASSTNTWEAGEVLEVYYDGTQYQCASGGGGTAERIKYNNTESGLSADNVQDAIDEIAEDVSEYRQILDNCYHEGEGEESEAYITGSDLQNGDQSWRSTNVRIILKKDSLIDVAGCSSVRLLIPTSAVASDTNIDRATMVLYNGSKVFSQALDLGWRYFSQGNINITVDLTEQRYEGIKYVGIYFGSNNINISPSSINTSGIVFTLVTPTYYTTKAIDEVAFGAVKSAVEQHTDMLSNCYHQSGGGGDEDIHITNNDLQNGTASWGSNSARITQKRDSIIDVAGKHSVTMFVPTSAVSSDTRIDRATLSLYNENKTYFAALDLGWRYFSDGDIQITIDLTDSQYSNVRYVGIYFGCASGSISPSSINTENIVFTLTIPSEYTTKAVDTEMLAEVVRAEWGIQLTGRDYIGERVSIGLPYTIERYSYAYENLGTLSSATGGRQGGAIYGDYLLQFHVNVGAIVFFNLSTKTNVQVLSLTAISNFHAGSGGFSDKFYDATDPFPLLYIAGMEQKKINVYRITGTAGSFAISLIQTITLNTPYYLPNIAIDAINERIVVFAYTQNSWGEATNNKSVVFYCDIPDYTTSEVTISAFGPVSKFPFIYAEQDAFAQYNMLYLSYGNTITNAGIIVFDYMNGQVKNVIGVKAIGNIEPEALGAYNGKMIMTTQTGNVYQLTF